MTRYFILGLLAWVAVLIAALLIAAPAMAQYVNYPIAPINTPITTPQEAANSALSKVNAYLQANPVSGLPTNNPTFTGTLTGPQVTTPTANITGGSISGLTLANATTNAGLYIPGYALTTNQSAPIFQNSVYTTSAATTVGAGFAFGAFLQQTDQTTSLSGYGGYLTGFAESLKENSPTNNGAVGLFGGINVLQAANNSQQSGVVSQCTINAPNTVSITCFGMNSVAAISATSQGALAGMEIDTAVSYGANLTGRIGLQVTDESESGGQTQATGQDAAIGLNNQYQPGTSIGFKTGIQFDTPAGFAAVATDGTLMKYNSTGTVANGLDFHTVTATNNWLNLGGKFIVNGSGAVQIGATTVAALPTCAAGIAGEIYFVTDASAPTFNGALTGGSNVGTLALCRSSGGTYAWVAH